MIIYRQILLRMKNISDKIVEKIRTHIPHSITFFFENNAVNEIRRKIMVQPNRPQMTWGYRHTIVAFPPATTVARMRLDITLHLHCLSYYCIIQNSVSLFIYNFLILNNCLIDKYRTTTLQHITHDNSTLNTTAYLRPAIPCGLIIIKLSLFSVRFSGIMLCLKPIYVFCIFSFNLSLDFFPGSFCWCM